MGRDGYGRANNLLASVNWPEKAGTILNQEEFKP